MNNNLLISTSILCALWENKKQDIFDLMLPFLKYSIYKNTKLNGSIDTDLVIEHMKAEFGYESIPHSVMATMLNRLSPQTLKKEHGTFYLKQDLSEEVNAFDKRKQQMISCREVVASALSNYLNSHMIGSNFNNETAANALINFFVSNGLCIAQNVELLGLMRSKDCKTDYEIAQFILEENRKNSDIFNYILTMVKGFFVSTAISLQPNGNVTESKFKNVTFYLDTKLIINALGLHLPEAKKSAIELLEMLKQGRATLACFEHNFQEISDIITAYKNGLRGQNTSSSLTLEAWDELHYTVTDVERYQKVLPNRIESLGITIKSKPIYSSETNQYSTIDENGLEARLGVLRYNSRGALLTDIKSVSSIIALRGNKKSADIEKCEYIFVTTNVALSNISNSFLGYANNGFAPPIITEQQISSIVWLKSYSTHKDFPKTKLIENASMVLEPSPAFLASCYDMIDRIESEGGLTNDEATLIRTDLYYKRELVKNSKGDISSLTPQTIIGLKDSLKERYSQDAKREEQLSLARNALDTIAQIGDKRRSLVATVLTVIIYIILGATLAVCAIFLIQDLVNRQSVNIGSIAFALVSFLGLYDSIFGRKKFIKKVIAVISQKCANHAMDKKRDEYSRLLGNLDLNRFL